MHTCSTTSDYVIQRSTHTKLALWNVQSASCYYIFTNCIWKWSIIIDFYVRKKEWKRKSTSFNPQTVALTSLCDNDPLDNWLCSIPAFTTTTTSLARSLIHHTVLKLNAQSASVVMCLYFTGLLSFLICSHSSGLGTLQTVQQSQWVNSICQRHYHCTYVVK